MSVNPGHGTFCDTLVSEGTVEEVARRGGGKGDLYYHVRVLTPRSSPANSAN
jgi:hypothetical protein